MKMTPTPMSTLLHFSVGDIRHVWKKMEEKRRERDEIETNKMDVERKLESARHKLESTDLDPETKKKIESQMDELQRQENEWRKKEEDFAQKERLEPWNVDTIGHEGWSSSRINKIKDKPEKQPEKSDEEKSKEYKQFFKNNEEKIEHYGQLRTWDDTEKFLLDHTDIICETTADFLTIDALNAGIEEDESLLHCITKQLILMQYLLELSKHLKTNPQAPDMIRTFFSKLRRADKDYMKGYVDEVEAFKDRIRRRAKEKRDEAWKEYEQEERKNRIAKTPGGLDPVEVYESLPELMRACFDERDISKLQEVSAKMDPEEFKYHLKRCIDSGMWVPGGGEGEGEAAPVPADEEATPTDENAASGLRQRKA